MGRCAMFMVAGLFAVALSLSCSTPATAQQVCQKAGDNKGSNDPNAVLNWTLTTRVNTPCIATVNPPSDWINTGRHVVVRPKHGRASVRCRAVASVFLRIRPDHGL